MNAHALDGSHATGGAQFVVNVFNTVPDAEPNGIVPPDITGVPFGSNRSNETSEVNEPRLSNTTSVARPSQSATVTDPVDPETIVAVDTVTPPCTKLITFPFHPSPY